MSQRRSLYVPNDDGTAILADYYDGAYGKTLRIDIQSLESLEAVLGLITNLCLDNAREMSLRNLRQTVLVPPLIDVRLFVSEDESISAVKGEHGIVIEWNNRQSGWEDVVELLRPLSQSTKGGHQYLTAPQADIMMELAFRE